MAQQSTLDVSKWQADRPKWLYTPALWFYFRMIEVAYLDAKTPILVEHPSDTSVKSLRIPTDEGLLARDWIARSQPAADADRAFMSFPECCEMLGLDAGRERVVLLAMIDAAVDYDTDEAWARLEELSAREMADDVEPLFDAPRVVPALDQLTLFVPEAA
jgi:hypothetical protein